MSAITQQLIVGLVFLIALGSMVKNLVATSIQDRPQITWSESYRKNNIKGK